MQNGPRECGRLVGLVARERAGGREARDRQALDKAVGGWRAWVVAFLDAGEIRNRLNPRVGVSGSQARAASLRAGSPGVWVRSSAKRSCNCGLRSACYPFVHFGLCAPQWARLAFARGQSEC